MAVGTVKPRSLTARRSCGRSPRESNVEIWRCLSSVRNSIGTTKDRAGLSLVCHRPALPVYDLRKEPAARKGEAALMSDHELYALGDLPLQNGGKLQDARLAYKTYGTLNAARTNAIVVPSAYGGTHADNEWLIGDGKALDTSRYFVVATNMFGNALSTSPSFHPPAGAFPDITVYDNVAAQHRLMTEKFGVKKIALVTGFSMGAQQSYHWACAYPELVERIAPVCGSARTSVHNGVFIDGIALTIKTFGTKTIGRLWAPWGMSAPFYRSEAWRELGFESAQAFVDEWYGTSFDGDPNDLLAMFWTWRHADISANDRFNGDFIAALGSIRARAVVMPSASDTYFPPEDSEIEVRHLANAELLVIPSVWGHAAGSGSSPGDAPFVANAL